MKTTKRSTLAHLALAGWLAVWSLLGATGCEGGGKDVEVEIPDNAAPANAATPEDMGARFEFD